MRGKLVVFEGIDGCGKSTQVEAVAAELARSGEQVEVLRFPHRSSPIGQIIDKTLKHETQLDPFALYLLFAANRRELLPQIRDALSRGATLLCDRYAYSGIAYCAATTERAPEQCLALESDLARPDAVFYFDISACEALRRIQSGPELFETEQTLERVLAAYARLRAAVGDASWHVLDASTPPAALTQRIVAEVRRTPANCGAQLI